MLTAPTEGELAAIYRTWADGVQDLTERELQLGVRKARDFTGYFTLSAFRELCRCSPADFGLPDPVTAMREACNAPFPKDRHQWSHPAVYLAACAVGWYDMQNRTERELLPLFERAYEAMVRRVMAGERLDTPVPRAIPEKIPQYLDKSENMARCAALKELLL